MHILNTLGPIFIIIFLGAWLTRIGLINENAKRVINGCCYWVGLPCLLALKIGTATNAGDAVKVTVPVVLCGTVFLIVISWLFGMLFKFEARKLATLVHVSFRGNLAYIGLPVISFAFAGTAYSAKAESTAALTLGAIVVFYNVVAVLVHLLSTHKVSVSALKPVFIKLATNPLMLACFAGMAWNRFMHADGIEVPVMVFRTMTMLGQFALPMALICVGCALVTTPVHDIASGALVSAMLKTVAGPLAGLFFARLLGAGAMETGIACLLMGAPTAVASYVLTEQLDGRPELAAAAIVTSTLVSAVTFSVIIAGIH